MIRLFLIAMTVISLEFGFQGISWASIKCPEAPEQTSRDYNADISGVITKFKRFWE